MYSAVKVDEGRNVQETLQTVFTDARLCLQAARLKWGKAGGLKFNNNPKAPILK